MDHKKQQRVYTTIDKELLYTFLQEEHLTVTGVAKALGITQQGFYYHSTKNVLPISYIYKISEMTDIPIKDLPFVDDPAIKSLTSVPEEPDECSQMLYALRGDPKTRPQYTPKKDISNDAPKYVTMPAPKKEIDIDSAIEYLQQSLNEMAAVEVYMRDKLAWLKSVKNMDMSRKKVLKNLIKKELDTLEEITLW